jgi:hypothetical protein
MNAQFARRTLALVISLTLLVLILLNLFDEDLTPRAQDMLTRARAPLEPKYDDLPFPKGLSFGGDAQPCQQAFCPSEKWDMQKAKISERLNGNATAIDRFENFVRLGGQFQRIAPTSLREHSQVMSLFKGVRWSMLKTNQIYYSGDFRTAFDRSLMFEKFLTATLSHHVNLIESLIILSLLRGNRDFVNQAAAGSEAFKKRLLEQKAAFELKVDFEQLAQSVVANEFASVNAAIGANMDSNFQLSDLTIGVSDETRTSGKTWLDVFMPLLFKPNKTLNLYAQTIQAQLQETCVRTEVSCENRATTPWYAYLINPVGRVILRVLEFQSTGFKKVYGFVNKLNQPLEIN